MNNPSNPEETIFEAAFALPARERAAFLDQACANDAGLRQRVEVLLQADAGTEGFLERPAPGVQRAGEATGSSNPSQTLIITAAPLEKTGDRIGRYKLLQQIGEGGCGVVYMAEQEEPVRRRVALKVIKLGMDTKSVIARFEAERQALAMMDHPNIAKVLDAGATETGRPYFVMELVHGIKITDYCDQNNLSTHERLGLFVQVCHAIQHAHQKGIIHRDIKPSNILVTLRDGLAVPKVIDFGIAKATTDQRLTDKTLFTQFGLFIGTPAYMSPEQAEMNELGIDTRSDIYSLGILLYELLTGTTPFDARELMKAGLEEIRRIIREDEPPRPSTRLSTMVAGELTTAASHRRIEAPKLIHLLRGDLDWVVMKALEKDRNRRYETANGLAEDVQNHLNNEPVNARPTSGLYRLQKAVRRHKGSFAAAAAIAVVLVMGVMASTWQAVRAIRATAVALAEKQSAEEEAAISTLISDIFLRLLGSADTEVANRINNDAVHLLDDYAANLEQKLDLQPETLAVVEATIGKGYGALNQLEKGSNHLKRALELRRGLFGSKHQNYADTLIEYTGVAMLAGATLDECEANLREALTIYRARGIHGQQVIRAFYALQLIVGRQGKWNEVEIALDEALAEARQSPGVDFPDIASMYHGLVTVRMAQSQYAEAEKIARASITMHLRLQGKDDVETGWAYYFLGEALQRQHKFIEALAAQKQALAIMQKWLPPDQASDAMVAPWASVRTAGSPPWLKASTVTMVEMALAHTQAMADEELYGTAEEELCFKNLQKIHAAIMAYRKDHQKMPDWLGDLVPAYLGDTDCLICPVQVRTGNKPDLSGRDDLRVASSYLYEFNALTNVFPDPYGLAAPGDTTQTWKEKQLARYGPIVPVVRCLLHSQQLSLTFGGERVKSDDGRWEDEVVLHVREETIAEINFKDKQPMGASAFTASERPVVLKTSVIERAGAGVGGGPGLVVTADGSDFTNNMKQSYAEFGVGVGVAANRASGVNTTNLDSYKLYATIRTAGLTGTNSHGRVYWQFLMPGGAAILTATHPATFTTNFQTYSFVLGSAGVYTNNQPPWKEFAAKFEQINALNCLVSADNWLNEYGPDADNALYISNVKFVRLVPTSTNAKNKAP